MLRLGAGDEISLSDGHGGWRPALLGSGGALTATGAVLRPLAAVPPVTVAFAVPKGDRGEWAVQKLTELGVERIVALQTARSVVRWTASRVEHHLARWRAVGRQAAMQSRRLQLPVIDGPTALVDFASCDATVMAEPGAPGLPADCTTVLIGPEGGWSDDELRDGPAPVSLLPTVLRTETAAIVAGTLLVARRRAH